MLDRNLLYKAYFTKDKLVHHHINSFNDFIDHGLQKVIDEVGTIETNIEDTYVRLGAIRVEKPTVTEADGAVTVATPKGERLVIDQVYLLAVDGRLTPGDPAVQGGHTVSAP